MRLFIETEFVWFLAKKKVSKKFCQMLLFLSVQLFSVSFASTKRTDQSSTSLVKSLHKTETKSDVICTGKEAKHLF